MKIKKNKMEVGGVLSSTLPDSTFSNEEKEKIKEEEMKNISPARNLPTIIITAVIMLLFIGFVGQFVVVKGSSMEPTYHSGKILFVEKISDNFETNDIVSVRSMNELIIKRVIGVPGDTVQIKSGQFYINGKLFNDIIKTPIREAGIASSPIKLEKNEYFIVGDNRNNSYDSRFEGVGIVNASQVFGRVVF